MAGPTVDRELLNWKERNEWSARSRAFTPYADPGDFLEAHWLPTQLRERIARDRQKLLFEIPGLVGLVFAVFSISNDSADYPPGALAMLGVFSFTAVAVGASLLGRRLHRRRLMPLICEHASRYLDEIGYTARYEKHAEKETKEAGRRNRHQGIGDDRSNSGRRHEPSEHSWDGHPPPKTAYDAWVRDAFSSPDSYRSNWE